MAVVVDGFSEHVAAMLLISSDFGHGKVCLREHRAFGVNPDEDLGNLVDSTARVDNNTSQLAGCHRKEVSNL